MKFSPLALFFNNFHSLKVHIIPRFTHIVTFSLADPALLEARDIVARIEVAQKFSHRKTVGCERYC